MQPKFIGPSLEIFKKNRCFLLWEGILFMLLGILAICAPVIFTIGFDFLFGFLFVVGGIAQIFRVFKTWGIEGSWPAFFWGILTLFAGGIMLANPVAGILALTSILIAFFFLEGVLKFVLAAKLGKEMNKFWLILSGALSIFLAVLIFAGLPETATWALGLIVGIDLLFFGVLLLGLYNSLPAVE